MRKMSPSPGPKCQRPEAGFQFLPKVPCLRGRCRCSGGIPSFPTVRKGREGNPARCDDCGWGCDGGVWGHGEAGHAAGGDCLDLTGLRRLDPNLGEVQVGMVCGMARYWLLLGEGKGLEMEGRVSK